MNIHDISPIISEKSPVYPGDTAFSRSETTVSTPTYLKLSSITTTTHIGAHTDAPIHYNRSGKSMDQVDLDPYIGDALLIDATKYKGTEIPPEVLTRLEAPLPKRALFKTDSFAHDKPYDANYSSISSDLILELAKLGVVLIGIDTPSIDPPNSEQLTCHKLVFQNDMCILEGLALQGINPGHYELIALPLRIKGADASPVRAILRKR